MRLDPKPRIVYEDLTEDERDVYDEAFSRFEKGETYACSKDNLGLRDKLQREFAGHCVVMFRRSRRARRGY